MTMHFTISLFAIFRFLRENLTHNGTSLESVDKSIFVNSSFAYLANLYPLRVCLHRTRPGLAGLNVKKSKFGEKTCADVLKQGLSRTSNSNFITQFFLLKTTLLVIVM